MIPTDKFTGFIAKFEQIEAAMATGTKGEEIVKLSKAHGEQRGQNVVAH